MTSSYSRPGTTGSGRWVRSLWLVDSRFPVPEKRTAVRGSSVKRRRSAWTVDRNEMSPVQGGSSGSLAA
jgi:hypothetical protein